jgi:hypothetical protein
LIEFVKLVKEMRKAQKAFFKYRRPLDMQTAKQLEKEVDKMIAALEVQSALERSQQELF